MSINTDNTGAGSSDFEKSKDDIQFNGETGSVRREDLHAFAVREGAPSEMIQGRPDSSSAKPGATEVQSILEDLEGQSVTDSSVRKTQPVEDWIPVGVPLDEADVLVHRMVAGD